MVVDICFMDSVIPYEPFLDIISLKMFMNQLFHQSSYETVDCSIFKNENLDNCNSSKYYVIEYKLL